MRRALAVLWIVLLLLLAFGLVLVSSASATQRGGALPFVRMQAIAIALGLAVSAALFFIDYRVWRRLPVVIAIALFCLLVSSAVFLFPKINGSHRWIMLGGLSLQPSEFARIGIVLVAAAWFDRIGGLKSRTFRFGILYPGMLLGLLVAPIAVSPDLGATVVCIVALGTLFVAAGVRWRYLFLLVPILAVLFALFVSMSPNRRARVMTFIDGVRGIQREEDPTAYHRDQSREAFVRGGQLGSGLGQSIQKYQYLPEANTDFIFAIAGEEFGLPVTAGMALAFLVMLWCGVYIAAHAPDRFGRLVALALTVLLVFEAAFNMGMATGCLPTKGIALPFNSYGGTSMIASLVAIGLLSSIGHAAIREKTPQPARESLPEF